MRKKNIINQRYLERPGNVFTFCFSSRIVNTIIPWLLLMTLQLSACKSPQVAEQTHEEKKIEAISSEHETSLIDDTLTIRHTIINDTTTETTVIRKIITQNEKSAQSLQEEHLEASHETKDTLTPAIMELLQKGITVACIGIAIVMAGGFAIFTIIVLRRKK